MAMQSWELDAACAPQNRSREEQHLDWFTTDPSEKYIARAICAHKCPVQKECMETALNRMEIWGIWGGADDYEIRRALSVDAHGDPLQRDRPPRCPLCFQRDLNISGQKTKSRGYKTVCMNAECGIEWYMATVPSKLKKKRVA